MNFKQYKYYITASIIFLFVGISYSQQGWVNQNSGITESLNSVKFINADTGWCAGNAGKILKTTNGGNNWILQGINFVGNLNSLFIISDNLGYIAGEKDSVGYIFKTTNGGVNWNSTGPLNAKSLKSVFFINSEIGFTGEYYEGFKMANVYKTTDGGLSWDSMPTEYAFVYDLQFFNETTGWLAGGYYALGQDVISKTTNGGLNWNIRANGSPPFHCVFFIDSLNGWAGGRSIFNVPSIIRTTNGGNNWNSIFPGTLHVINDIDFINEIKGWAVGEDRIIQATTNSGINWIDQTSAQLGINYYSVSFTDSLTGWVVGDSGIILKTTTGGVITGFSNTSTEIPDRYYLSQNYPNPFNPVTNLEFEISDLGFVSLKIYDVSGKEIKTLVNEIKQPGMYKVEFDGSSLASGIYFYTIEAGSFLQTKRMLLLK